MLSLFPHFARRFSEFKEAGLLFQRTKCPIPN
uniref:Uncharacterized protein n=1 Tax=Rhizophora mucronata TaxID=61149 RepID=A0A2P2P4Q2_RHIMU